jgi:hypothetical protein
VYFRKSYPTKEKDSQGYAGFGNQGKAFSKIQLHINQYNMIFAHYDSIHDLDCRAVSEAELAFGCNGFTQSDDFYQKRFILDNFILVQRTARYVHQQRQARILFKLDISKAFDSVSWPFLIEVLRKMGFGQIWCDVVCGLLASSSTRILLNGVPGEIISHQRGLRQGDPLSPMLFILVMDVLNLLIQKASDEGLLQQLSSGTLHHRLFLYADDVVVFLRPVASDINLVLEILRLFG